MYAIIKTGGKQYRVSPGDVLRVEKLIGATGSTVEFPALAHQDGSAGNKRSAVLLGAQTLRLRVASISRTA